jgi:hypothetical protein
MLPAVAERSESERRLGFGLTDVSNPCVSGLVGLRLTFGSFRHAAERSRLGGLALWPEARPKARRHQRASTREAMSLGEQSATAGRGLVALPEQTEFGCSRLSKGLPGLSVAVRLDD